MNEIQCQDLQGLMQMMVELIAYGIGFDADHALLRITLH